MILTPTFPPTAAPGHAPILLTDDEAAALYRVSKRTLQELEREPWFPRPVILGPRLKRHVRTELEAATANMPRATERQQPASLLRARIERMKSTGVAA